MSKVTHLLQKQRNSHRHAKQVICLTNTHWSPTHRTGQIAMQRKTVKNNKGQQRRTTENNRQQERPTKLLRKSGVSWGTK